MREQPIIPKERQVQRAILKMLGECFPKAFVTAIPNGAHLAGDSIARFKQMGALKGDGLKVGFPDLLVLWAHRHGALIEVKRPVMGTLSEVQIAMHARLEAIGWEVFTVTSQQEAFDALRAAGAPWNGVGI